MKNWVAPNFEDAKNWDPHEVFLAGERNHSISNTAYPIAHEITWKSYRVSSSNHSQIFQSAFEDKKEINLYSHIPFCESRCYFCEYTVVNPKENLLTKMYMDALNQEVRIHSKLTGKKKIIGFDIGGGTPSFVDADLIQHHLDTVSKFFYLPSDTEISIETTPKIASSDQDKLNKYSEMGIKRISMGIQVTQPDLLINLGRKENGIFEIKKAVENIRNAGFKKLNLDLMYGFANQSIESWKATLQFAIESNPEYITLYRMRYKLTKISYQAKQVDLNTVKEMSKIATAILNRNGYFANPGKNTFTKSLNETGTSQYLRNRVIHGISYLGVGLGAQSMSDSTISYNSGSVGKNLTPYLKIINSNELPIQDLYNLPLEHMMAKMISVSFYFGEINLSSFLSKFQIRLEDAFPNEVNYVLDKGLMEYRNSQNGSEDSFRNQNSKTENSNRSLSLTNKGAEFFNGTIALFFASSIQKYLICKEISTKEAVEINLEPIVF
jgi:oxygen-independent coproporphyrinogen-3 oxidase